MREESLKMAYSNRISIIVGATGSGKTTQIPKFLFQENERRHIIVTQPRVISCIANTLRVSDELLSETGNPNYSVGMRV
jgi:HrpA-like RNA helicase